ncbi:hypothetical protein K491DRAFT_311042 [Lophiostoma macrostomum CBS 122681]|uniref:Uncharacterized protein n=1 Tax=Lophiostoma macrostomum CBS 122681 TaxID=1314788 RepID=A0A6A6TCP4_9PLEO|nr:hypothetical protein K491DRAFT_311042 [Lophiostoma macrostomum CBS 122681]
MSPRLSSGTFGVLYIRTRLPFGSHVDSFAKLQVVMASPFNLRCQGSARPMVIMRVFAQSRSSVPTALSLSMCFTFLTSGLHFSYDNRVTGVREPGGQRRERLPANLRLATYSSSSVKVNGRRFTCEATSPILLQHSQLQSRL